MCCVWRQRFLGCFFFFLTVPDIICYSWQPRLITLWNATSTPTQELLCWNSKAALLLLCTKDKKQYIQPGISNAGTIQYSLCRQTKRLITKRFYRKIKEDPHCARLIFAHLNERLKRLVSENQPFVPSRSPYFNRLSWQGTKWGLCSTLFNCLKETCWNSLRSALSTRQSIDLNTKQRLGSFRGRFQTEGYLSLFPWRSTNYHYQQINCVRPFHCSAGWKTSSVALKGLTQDLSHRNPLVNETPAHLHFFPSWWAPHTLMESGCKTRMKTRYVGQNLWGALSASSYAARCEVKANEHLAKQLKNSCLVPFVLLPRWNVCLPEHGAVPACRSMT